MLIENVEALKSWLTSRLEPICDADPAALAKYVVALVKKDKTTEELKHVCKDQLEVFLSDDTNKFVEVLFEALDNNSYIPSTMSPSVPIEKTQPVVTEEMVTTKSVAETSVPDDDERDFRRTRRNTDPNSKAAGNDVVSIATDKLRKRKAEDEIRIENHKVQREDLVSSARKSDSDVSEADKQKSDVGSRNNGTQPIPSTWEGNRDRDRRYQGNRDRDYGSRLDEEGRYRRGGVWSRIDRNAMRDRDRERDRDRDREERSGRSRGFRDRHLEGRFGRVGGMKARCRDYEEKGFCIRGELCPYDHGNDPVIIGQDIPPMPNIMPFPGPPPFIAGGAPLPGMPPPILSAPNNFPQQLVQPPPPGAGVVNKNDAPAKEKPKEKPNVPVPPPPGVPPVMVLPPPVRMPPPPMITMLPPRPLGFPPADDSYNPEQPQFDRPPVWMRVGTGIPLNPDEVTAYTPDMGMRSRELLNVQPDQPQITVQVSTDQPTGETSRIVTGPPGLPDNAATNQSDQQIQGKTLPIRRRYSDTLEIKKIPREFNNITKLNDYFKKFGNIVNIQVNAFNDPEAALVKFTNHFEAKTAYKCADAVLGNRFIRVFWHNEDQQQASQKENSVATELKKKPFEAKKPTMFQSGKTTFVRSNKPSLSTAEETTTTASPTVTIATAVSQAVPTPVTTTVSTPVTKLDPRKEMMRKKLEIQKQKQELLDKQIQQQKLLISKLEKKNLTAAEKEAIMKTLKMLSSNIDGMKQEVEIASMTVKSKDSPIQARQIAQKAILDQELDLFTHQQHGEDTTELKKKVEELKQEAKYLGLFDPPTRGRGVSPGRGRGRGHASRGHVGRGRAGNSRVWTRESAVFDRRSRQLSVAGITAERKTDIVEHFMEFGNVDRFEYDVTTLCLVLTFKTRKEAEIAFNKGRRLKDQMLDITWYCPASPTAASAASPTTPTSTGKRSRSATLSSSGLDDELALDLTGDVDKHDVDQEAEEALLLDFDEEEDEEERSWRR